MVSTDPAFPHSHKPHKESLDLVVEAFRRHGITLVIDPEHTEIPEHRVVAWPQTGACRYEDEVAFGDLKSQYFHPKNNLPWHYMIFAHDTVNEAESCFRVSGVAQLPGYDFVVAHGFLFFAILGGHPFRVCPDDNFTELCQRIEGGTFMHELGHNLSLDHGGDNLDNYKPNYLSVMNYLFQKTGIPYGNSPDDPEPGHYRLDYSDRLYPSLDEFHLDERLGIGGSDDSVDFTLHPVSRVEPDGSFTFIYSPVHVHGPVDWNFNGAIEPDVQFDANFSRTDLDFHYSVLTGFDDWAQVHAFLNTPEYRNGFVRQNPRVIGCGTLH
jgi:hypothetical protein